MAHKKLKKQVADEYLGRMKEYLDLADDDPVEAGGLADELILQILEEVGLRKIANLRREIGWV